MRFSKILSSVVATAALAGLTFTSLAHAEDEFDVTVQGGNVVVVAKGHWHINKDFPWKVESGATKLDKSKFAFTETSATLAGAPKGKVHVKGGVCNGGQCRNFDKEVEIK
jgi:hypothetical protein